MTFPLRLLYKPLHNWFRQLVAHPKYRWWIIGGTLIYLLSPLDILPDAIPLIGEIDDAVLVTLVVSEVSQLLIDRFKANKEQKNQEVA
jgi:uncharacterized membrane protein YkvA (DUF1232 family)